MWVTISPSGSSGCAASRRHGLIHGVRRPGQRGFADRRRSCPRSAARAPRPASSRGRPAPPAVPTRTSRAAGAATAERVASTLAATADRVEHRREAAGQDIAWPTMGRWARAPAPAARPADGRLAAAGRHTAGAQALPQAGLRSDGGPAAVTSRLRRHHPQREPRCSRPERAAADHQHLLARPPAVAASTAWSAHANGSTRTAASSLRASGTRCSWLRAPAIASDQPPGRSRAVADQHAGRDAIPRPRAGRSAPARPRSGGTAPGHARSRETGSTTTRST